MDNPERISVDIGQIEKIGLTLSEISGVTPFDFCDPVAGAGLYPPVGSEIAVDYFFAATLHQYGFWLDDGERYQAPYYGRIDGEAYKGSEFLWKTWLRAAAEIPDFLSPRHQSELGREELEHVFRTDDGPGTLPMLDSHLELARAFGRDLLTLGVTPAELVRTANESPNALATFLGTCSRLGGYDADPLNKKASLLAIILKNRPERFLQVNDGDLRPIVDYHIQRTFLRTGMVKVEHAALESALADRRFVDSRTEEEIRRTVYRAVELLADASGKDVAAIDFFFFSFRKLCHEVGEPDCGRCRVAKTCARNAHLFQPVFRTTFY